MGGYGIMRIFYLNGLSEVTIWLLVGGIGVVSMVYRCILTRWLNKRFQADGRLQLRSVTRVMSCLALEFGVRFEEPTTSYHYWAQGNERVRCSK